MQAEVTVTQADIEAVRHFYNSSSANLTGQELVELEQALARHRAQAERETLARMEPVACRYPVHGSVTHVRNVECCDFCGHPADLPPAPEAGQ